MKISSQRGIALVVTLIMLSVITIIAVAFLAVSRRERASVTQAADLVTAEQAANTALERCRAQLLASTVANTNPLAVDLTVSRNFINPGGFQAAGGPIDPVNVSYVYANGQPLNNADDMIRNSANLLYDPRPPVFIATNRTDPLEFRFYVDLNRNGRFETNGFLEVLDDNGRAIPVGNTLWTNFFVGDPEWIGILERPNQPHSRTNRFIARYAYAILPAGRMLDLNYIHNQANRVLDMNLGATATGKNGFRRNQGLGSWELNLAAFLADLNANYWNTNSSPYRYDTNFVSGGVGSSGAAFSDATDLLRFRYTRVTDLPGMSPLSPQSYLGSAESYFGLVAGPAFTSDQVDSYANGPVDGIGADDDPPDKPWSGSDSTNHFFTPHDLFNTSKSALYIDFINNLARASAANSSYNRYTFYDMLKQMGTDSLPEPEIAEPSRLIQKLRAVNALSTPEEPVGRINLNYDNLTTSPTAFSNWNARTFFLTTADVLLRSQLPFGVTNIPVSPTNYYSQAVHRLLQVAANLVDATTTNRFPSVFRPEFFDDGAGNIFISGYYEDGNYSTVTTNMPYGIPYVVGVKKGIPNFNEYVMQTAVQGVRKLELRRLNTNAPPIMTNQMFILGISNYFALESWNAYTQAFAKDLEMQIVNTVQVSLTNQDGLFVRSNYTFNVLSNFTAGTWRGWNLNEDDNASFRIPLSVHTVMLTGAVYRASSRSFDLVGLNQFEQNAGYPIPSWGLSISNQLFYVLADKAGGRILDFVYLPHLDTYVNIMEKMARQDPQAQGQDIPASCWRTNRLYNATDIYTPTEGIVNQILISMGVNSVDPADWRDYNSTVNDMLSATRSFRAFVQGSNGLNPDYIVQAPFAATRKFVQTTKWQANDPLVHYTVDDLRDLTNNTVETFVRPLNSQFNNDLNLGWINDRCRPWKGHLRKQNDGQTDPNAFNIAVKDPGVRKPDDWNFPTNKFPSIGWLGRVHRGTPWQTIYLKSQVATPGDWLQQSLTTFTHPTNDWKLADIFTIAPNANATRGLLSINQTNLAAWSAALSSVLVFSNAPITTARVDDWVPSANFIPQFVQPGSPQLQALVHGINRTRATFPGQTFRRLSDWLSVPELTVQSPFLEQMDPLSVQAGFNDEAYERIPQQVLSLLKVGEARYVIYCFGQSLRPAPRSVQPSGPYPGICTNYQITGEVYTRAVARVTGSPMAPRVAIESFNNLPAD